MLISSLVLILLSTILSSSNADCGCNKLNRPEPVQKEDSLQNINTQETKEEYCFSDTLCDNDNTVKPLNQKLESEELNVESENDKIDYDDFLVQIEDDSVEINEVDDTKSNGKFISVFCVNVSQLSG